MVVVVRVGRLQARQVDALLKVLTVAVLATGAASFTLGTPWARAVTAVHGIAGLSLVVLAPAKISGSVRTGLRRRSPTRWLSIAFGGLVLTTVGLGVLHSTGLWYGIGYWSALWTHVAVGVALVAVFVWHVRTRPSSPRVADLDRRAVLRAGGVLGLATLAYGAQETAVRLLGLAGGERRFTGSHETAAFDPSRMPSVSWLDDRSPPSTNAAGWELAIGESPVSIDALWELAQPVEATLDCTGGWYSTQLWDAVPLARLLEGSGHTIRVESITGYDRLFPARDAPHLYLAVGYGGAPLRRTHGAPVRLVAPGRRGPWWVKWVTSVRLDGRPWWMQTPLPIE